LYESFITALHSAESTSTFVHTNDKSFADCRYKLTGTGDVNMYALFAELIYTMMDAFGTAGFIVPSGIATDDGTKVYFGKIATSGMLKSLYDFENREGLFPTVDSRFKFCLLTLAQKDGMSDFAFFLHNLTELEDSRRHFTMTPEDFDLINPNTHTCPVFRSEEDAKLAKKIYKKVGVFVNESLCHSELDSESGNPWKIKFSTMYHMSNDSGLFINEKKKDYLPLYEAKMMYQFDHRWNTFVNGEPKDVTVEQKEDPNFTVTPQYYVPYAETVLRTTTLDLKIVQALRELIASTTLSNQDASVGERSRTDKKLRELIREKAEKFSDDLFSQSKEIENGKLNIENEELKILNSRLSTLGSKDLCAAVFEVAEKLCPKYLMGWRDITNATNERTMIFTVIPFCGAGNTLQLAYFDNKISTVQRACFVANVTSLSFDFATRFKIGGTHLNMFITKQLPVLPPSSYHEAALNFIVPSVMALTYTATDMTEWAKALWKDSSLKMRLKMLQLHETLNQVQGDSSRHAELDSASVNREFSESFLPPYIFDDAKRAVLRAELDAYFARLYGLTRTELQYILDPHSVMGEDYPSETFRVLKDNEIAKYGEYRTQRLVLEAWDRLE
nr:hypothetical protein [Treponema sp.]